MEDGNGALLVRIVRLRVQIIFATVLLFCPFTGTEDDEKG